MVAESVLRLSLSGTLLVLLAGPTGSAMRFVILGHELMCSCGCNQLLLECNHAGCGKSSPMLTELRATIERGNSDAEVLHAFEAQYGPAVLAAPPFSGFHLVAWLMPPAVLLLGAVLAVLLIRRWRRATTSAGDLDTPDLLAIRTEIRKGIEP